MPKMIGNTIDGSINIADYTARVSGDLVSLTYSQAVRLAPEAVVWERNVTDKGGPGRVAKRWNNWYASVEAVMSSPVATECMLRRAARQAEGYYTDLASRETHIACQHSDCHDHPALMAACVAR